MRKMGEKTKMASPGACYSKEEFARRGDEIYDRDVRPQVEPGNEGKIVAIDIETGAWEMDADEIAGSRRLAASPRGARKLRSGLPASAHAASAASAPVDVGPRHDRRCRDA